MVSCFVVVVVGVSKIVVRVDCFVAWLLSDRLDVVDVMGATVVERVCFRRFVFGLVLLDTEASGAFVVNENLWRVLVVVDGVVLGELGINSFSASSTYTKTKIKLVKRKTLLFAKQPI